MIGCLAQPGTGGPFPGLAEYSGREVREVEFSGRDLQVPVDSLRAILAIQPTVCRLEFLPLAVCPGLIGRNRTRLDLQELARDLLRIQLYYRDQGYYGTRVDPAVTELGGDDIALRFNIVPGDEVVLRELDVEGADSLLDPALLERRLPLAVGEPFSRIGFLSSADTVRSLLQQRGHVYADVLRNYSIDTIADVAEAQFVALPGPPVLVDSVLVIGAARLGRSTVVQQLSFNQGDTLRLSDLNRSQRNLYSLESVNFASVDIAPDTLQADPDSSRATVLVRIVEAPKYLVDATAGFGTIDCIRTGVRWVNRNFLGGARRLEISGSVSKIGVGQPADLGLENSLCSALGDDPFSRDLNYALAADFQQPRLFGTRTALGLGLHANRQSELKTYLRQSVGGRVTASRVVGPTLVGLTADVQRGSTQAPDAVFCIGFDLCSPADVQQLTEARWSNSMALSAIWDRTSGAPYTLRGFQLRGNTIWSSPVLGSDDQYLRLLADGAAYREVRPGWVVAGRLQAGAFVEGTLNPRTGFIPPEQRFYAGGPNSVRGFERNALGPRAYVLDTLRIDEAGDTTNLNTAAASATGGTELVVGSLELRVPSPLLGQYLRLAGFVDAGQVWAPGTRASVDGIRITPGAGLRFITPIGPIRLDVAYNPYGNQLGPLYLVDEDNNLQLIRRSFAPEAGGFLDRLQFQFAVGQAF